jgi:NADPH:quinone reductase-like Zn-dependent oxidoreductase
VRTPDVLQVSGPTVWLRSAHNPMVAQRELPVTIPRIGAFEAALQWVIPSNVSSHASTESRRKEPGIMESLLDATVVITGASSGIGLATAQASARRSANVLRTTPH